MKLPFSKLLQRKEAPKFFLALLLRDEKVTAVVFEELDGKARVLGKHEEHFINTVETAEIDELLEVLDKTISTAESSLPSNIETENTVFGLKETWVSEAKIKPEYLQKIKKLCDTLGLKPMGFLVIHEAIAHYLKQTEGAPVSAILVEVDKKYLVVSLVRAGRIIETKRTKVEDSVPKTTDRLLHHFTQFEVLPSRIIVFDGDGIDELVQEFHSHAWSKSIPFLHVPQIVALESGVDAQAVLAGTAEQMGFQLQGMGIRKAITESDDSVKHNPKEGEEENLLDEAKDIEDEEIEKSEKDESEELSNIASEFGFVAKDSAEQSLKEKKEESAEDTLDEEKEDSSEKNSEEDTKQRKLIKKDPHFADESRGEDDIEFEDVKEQFLAEKELIEDNISLKRHSLKEEVPTHIVKKQMASASLLAPLQHFFGSVSHKATQFSRGAFKKGGKKVLIPPAILLIVILVVVWYLFGVKATVVLDIKPKTVEQTKAATFVLEKQTDVGGGIIAADIVSVSEEGDLSTSATGTKDVGEKAKGTIVLYGRFAQEKTIPAGTSLTSSNDLVFITDDSVKIASVSAADSSASTAKVAVTAKAIGKESNLPSGAKFTVGTFTAAEVIGKNDSAFSGGNKKEVTVVSKKDVDKLTADLGKNLASKAQEQVKKQLSDDQMALPSFFEQDVSKTSFDKKVGEEASSVTITGTVAYKTFVYNKKDMEQFTKGAIKDAISGMQLAQDGISYTVSDVKKKSDNEIQGNLKIKAAILPKLDIASLQQQIAGKSFNDAVDILIKIPQVEDAIIKLNPSIPLLPQILPRIPGNIVISPKG